MWSGVPTHPKMKIWSGLGTLDFSWSAVPPRIPQGHRLITMANRNIRFVRATSTTKIFTGFLLKPFENLQKMSEIKVFIKIKEADHLFLNVRNSVDCAHSASSNYEFFMKITGYK